MMIGFLFVENSVSDDRRKIKLGNYLQENEREFVVTDTCSRSSFLKFPFLNLKSNKQYDNFYFILTPILDLI